VDVLYWRDPASRQARRLSHDNPETQERVLFAKTGGSDRGGAGGDAPD
jgi:hypothetical protein